MKTEDQGCLLYTSQQIVVHADQYFDRFGKAAIHDEEILKKYILNIYKVLLTRAIRGTYVYVCDPALRNYFKDVYKRQEFVVCPGLSWTPGTSESIFTFWATVSI